MTYLVDGTAMQSCALITRRFAVLAAAGMVMGGRAAIADDGPPIRIEDVEWGNVPIKRYVAKGSGRRPTILLLHGSKGLDANLQAYDIYARDLAAAGIDALLFSYFSPGELKAIGDARDAAARRVQYERSVDRWVAAVRAIAASVQGRDDASSKVGLLGFSLGGFLAVAAASEPMFSVLTVFYAGLPDFYRRPITSLPPLLDIHGDADHSVSLATGRKLVATAQRLGGVAELVVFPNEGHAFDLHSGNRDAADARTRAIAFASRYLT